MLHARSTNVVVVVVVVVLLLVLVFFCSFYSKLGNACEMAASKVS